MAPRLRCRLAQDLNPEAVTCTQTFWLDQDADKKSSFLFEQASEGSTTKIEKPSHLIIDCCQSENESVTSCEWLFGGLEIHTNSRNIEVYAIPEGKDFNGREYWQTHQGSKVEGEENGGDNGVKDACEKELYQTIILPPSSKPTSVTSLHLKLLSLRPAKCTVAFVKSVKLKGRIPDEIVYPSSTAQVSQAGEASSRAPNQPTAMLQQSPATDSTAQVASAISALSIMIQNIHGSMESSIQSTIGEFQSMAYTQSHNLSGKIVELEKSVSGLRDSVEILNTNVELLRTENETHRKESDIAQKKLEDVEKLQCDRVYIREILAKERKLMVQEMQKQNDEMISQVVAKLISQLDTKNDVGKSSVTERNEATECTQEDDESDGRKEVDTNSPLQNNNEEPMLLSDVYKDVDRKQEDDSSNSPVQKNDEEPLILADVEDINQG